MANHPSRGWRRRGALAAEAHVQSLSAFFGAKRPVVVVLSTAELQTYIRCSFQAGFEAGRLDVITRRGGSNVHPSR